MNDYLKIPKPDATILERISEADVTMWIAARLAQLRETTPQIYNLQTEADFRKYRDEEYYDVNWSGHALDKCALTHTTVESMAKELRQELLGNPKARAAEAKRKAAALMKEAEELEALPVG